MNFLQRLRMRLTGRAAMSSAGLQRLPANGHEEHDADTNVPAVAFDQVERLSGSGASLETLLEMNRVQGW